MHSARQSKHPRAGLFRPVASALLTLAVTPLLPAQTAAPKPAPTAEEIITLEAFTVVSGFAGSLAAAAEIKQKTELIAEVVAAEDIGKLPDISIAESLTRLPGLTTQRLNGRAQAIVIRGLSGDFSTALLNGREQVSTGAGRSVEFDQYPAELLSGVVVYKTTDASLVGQGLAGTVDLRTVRPLSVGRRTVAANFFYEWTDMASRNAGADDSGTRGTFTYVDQLQDGKLGIAFGYSTSSRPGQGEQWNAWGYPDTGSGQPLVLGGAKPFIRTSELERDGYMGVIEYAPSDRVRSTLDLYYSDFRETQLLRGIEMPLWWSSAQLQPGSTVQNGLITTGTFRNVFGVMRNDIVTRDSDVKAAGWNLELGDNDGWKVELDLSTSRIKRKDFVLETYSGFGQNQVGAADTVIYRLGEGEGGAKFTTALDYTNASQLRLTSPQGWGSGTVPGGQVGFLKGPLAEDEIGQYRISASRPLDGFFNKLEFGAAYTSRSKFEYEAGPQGKEGFFLALKNGATSAPMPPSVGVSDLSFIGIRGMYSYDPLALFNSGFYELRANDNPAYVSNNWDVDEKILLGYVKLNLERKLGSVPMYGNIGAQVVQSDQTATGLSANGASITPVKGSHDYVDFVPSLNLNWDLDKGRYLRFSATRQLARQRMNDMRAGSTYGYNSQLATSTDPLRSPWTGGGGNPKLEPWRSNSFDVSYEQFFADNMGYWSVAAFYKDLVSYTYNQRSVVSYAGLPTGLAPGAPGATPAITLGTRDIPQNGQGGSMRGVEFTLSLPGEKLSDALKGWGFVGSTSFFDSSIKPDLGNPATPIPGLSERVTSATLYYERAGFAARTSVRYRSDYRGDIATFGPRGEIFRNLQAETVIDAQVSYTFRDGPMKDFAVILQGYNLTDEPLFASEGTDTRRVQDYQLYGANYSIGVSYKF
jgi:iron complex outermembrane recepter protein